MVAMVFLSPLGDRDGWGMGWCRPEGKWWKRLGEPREQLRVDILDEVVVAGIEEHQLDRLCIVEMRQEQDDIGPFGTGQADAMREWRLEGRGYPGQVGIA